MGHSVGLVLVATREWFIRFLHTTKSLGVPGSSRGTLECNRVDLTVSHASSLPLLGIEPGSPASQAGTLP